LVHILVCYIVFNVYACWWSSWPWPWEGWVLGLGLEGSVLGLGLGLEGWVLGLGLEGWVLGHSPTPLVYRQAETERGIEVDVHEWVHAKTFVKTRTVSKERSQCRLEEQTKDHLIVTGHRKHTHTHTHTHTRTFYTSYANIHTTYSARVTSIDGYLPFWPPAYVTVLLYCSSVLLLWLDKLSDLLLHMSRVWVWRTDPMGPLWTFGFLSPGKKWERAPPKTKTCLWN